ncbi:hypothetical protein WJX82_006311 [Trebouxia sp. C0006]
MGQKLFGVEPDIDGLPSNLFNAEQVADDDPAMQFTVEQTSAMRQQGQPTSNQTDAPDPAFYSSGAVRDFRSKGLKATCTGTLTAQQLVEKLIVLHDRYSAMARQTCCQSRC